MSRDRPGRPVAQEPALWFLVVANILIPHSPDDIVL